MIARIYHYALFILIFIKALIVANWQVVKLALSPTLNIKPGFISVPMAARGDFEITVLANSITLTPGTISVHVPKDRKSIAIHAIDVGDNPDAIRRDVIDTLETNIMKWTSPGNSPGKTNNSDHTNSNTDSGASS